MRLRWFRRLGSWAARLPPALAERVRREAPRLGRSPLGVLLSRSLARRLLRSGLFDAAAYARTRTPAPPTPLACAQAYLQARPPPVSAAQPLFDPPRYRAATALVEGADLLSNAAVHRRAEAAALTGFDPAAYLQANPDLRLQGCDPLRHYLIRGRRENRWPPPAATEPDLPAFDWNGLAARPGGGSAQVTVIVPVHGARARTLLCLERLLTAACDLPHRVLVVDDASPDMRLREELAELARRGLMELIASPDNLGFSAAVNLAMRQRRVGDLVLLNSDTEVFDGWLDRLHRVAHAQARVGTVTPLSNSATILSYPIRLRDNPLPLELDWPALDRIFMARGHAPVETPTAVGFCMYVTRACLDETGELDALAFPRGYGEENDFCLRAAAKGWLHLAAADTFVAHHGAASFGPRRAALVATGLKVLSARYPAYRTQVDAFIAADPLAELRLDADISRLGRRAPMLTAVHSAQERCGPSELQLVFDPSGGELLLHNPDAPATPNLPMLDVLRRPEQAVRVLRQVGVSRLRLQDRRWMGERRARALETVAYRAGMEVLSIS